MHFSSPPYVSHVLRFTVTKVRKRVTERSVRHIGVKLEKKNIGDTQWWISQATSHGLREYHAWVMRNFYIWSENLEEAGHLRFVTNTEI
jgi:hypothetical protein